MSHTSPLTDDKPNPVLQKDPDAYRRFSHKDSKPRGGFIVHRRGATRGDLVGRVRPAEHASLESAIQEAHRLCDLHAREFVVFQDVYSAIPDSLVGGRS